jgi:hypothetical protein
MVIEILPDRWRHNINNYDVIVLESITLNEDAVKKSYNEGDKLNLGGLTVTANYSDGTSAVVSGYATSPVDGSVLNEIGDQTIVVIYTEDDVTVNEFFTVYVEEEVEVIIKVTVTFDANGGTGGPSPVEAIFGKALPVITDEPEYLPSHYFTGYFDAVTDGTKYYAADLTPVKGEWDKIIDATLYAHWTNISVPVYDIVFHANDGTNRMETQEIPVSTPTALRPNSFKIAGYMVKGWATTPTGIVKYENEEVFNSDLEDTIHLYAVWAFDPNAFQLGATGPGGGKIYYISEEGFTVQMADSSQNYTAHYLEAAPVSFSVPWGAHGKIIPGITTIAFNSGEDVNVIGNGRKDTQLIIDYLAKIPEKNRAAQLCDEYTNNGIIDWFLPSLGELSLLYASGVSVSGITKGQYWSSAQATTGNSAWIVDFNSGIRGYGTKTDNYRALAVRAF